MGPHYYPKSRFQRDGHRREEEARIVEAGLAVHVPARKTGLFNWGGTDPVFPCEVPACPLGRRRGKVCTRRKRLRCACQSVWVRGQILLFPGKMIRWGNQEGSRSNCNLASLTPKYASLTPKYASKIRMTYRGSSRMLTSSPEGTHFHS